MLEKNVEYGIKGKYDEMYFYIQDLCLCIAKHLKSQDDFYGFVDKDKDNSGKGHQENPYSYRLGDRFQECPWVQYFLYENEGRKDFIAQVMMRLREFQMGV